MAASRTCPETVQMVQQTVGDGTSVEQTVSCMLAFGQIYYEKQKTTGFAMRRASLLSLFIYDVSKTASLPSGNRNRANDLWTDMMFFFCEHLMKCYEKNGTRGSTPFLTAWRATGISSFPVVPNSRSFAAPDSYVLPPPCLSFSRTASCPPAC